MNFTAKFSQSNRTITVKLTQKSKPQIGTQFDNTVIVPVLTERYTGPTDVTPSTEDDIVLETKGKTMRDDVTVREIPFAEATNPSGGTTITIGG